MWVKVQQLLQVPCLGFMLEVVLQGEEFAVV